MMVQAAKPSSSSESKLRTTLLSPRYTKYDTDWVGTQPEVMTTMTVYIRAILTRASSALTIFKR